VNGSRPKCVHEEFEELVAALSQKAGMALTVRWLRRDKSSVAIQLQDGNLMTSVPQRTDHARSFVLGLLQGFSWECPEREGGPQ